MKVLGWLHNKFKHNSTASFKTSTESRSCFACLGKHGVDFKDFPSDVKLENEEDIINEGLVNELFLGFLAIGTLGGELINKEPPTPTFPSIFEDATNEEQKMTENELKLVSSKLEQFFEAEREETANKTSARSSHASVITLSNYQTEEINTEDQRHIVTCPLQKYLFGSSLELLEAEMPIKKGKNSLGELFQENTGHSNLEERKENKGKKQAKKRDATPFMKKTLKKIQPVSVNTKTQPGDAGRGSFLKKKLPKVFKSFHKKVHPEESMTSKESTKSCDKRFEESFCKFDYQGANPTMVTNSSDLFSMTRSVPPTANREHWIKTDTEYLVLEL